MLPCVYRCSLFLKMNRKFLKRYVGLKRILVNRIFCIIILNMQGELLRKWHREDFVSLERDVLMMCVLDTVSNTPTMKLSCYVVGRCSVISIS